MSQTVIGSSMVVDGEISGDESLMIHGTVKGKIRIKEALQLTSSGIIEADIEAATLSVSGQINGNVIASEKLELTAEGRLIGDVKTPRILIAEGATFKGKVDMDL